MRWPSRPSSWHLRPRFRFLIDDPNLRGLTGVLEFGLQGAERNQFPRERSKP